MNQSGCILNKALKTPLLAVLIDADNISHSNARAIFKEIATLGEASVRRIYGDFSVGRLKGWAEILSSFAILPEQQFANTVGKNSSDIALVIDAMDLLHAGRFDGFVLVSSDSDFTRLASRIREQGLDVYGIGERKTPDAFRQACKRFIFVENLVSEESDTKPKTATLSKRKAATPLIREALAAMEPDGDWYPLASVGQQLVANHPDFDPRTYGSRNLSTLVEALTGFEIDRSDRSPRIREMKARPGGSNRPARS